ncbi:hypothetical protein [Vulcanisaeta souniana]|nr:hypothetical protein [Vulcanisaeta souniana]BDR91773.1 hypothetical protein Vsou_08660 [Vulcanisaeta souniana JCM 11219]
MIEVTYENHYCKFQGSIPVMIDCAFALSIITGIECYVIGIV